jgi:tetratricopeptide (TPR) repeat protein
VAWNSSERQSPKADYLLRQAREQISSGNYPEAIISLHQAISCCPDAPDAYVDLGMCHEYLEQDAEACAWYDQAIALDPYHANAWFSRGMVLKRSGQEHEGLRSIQRAIELYCSR